MKLLVLLFFILEATCLVLLALSQEELFWLASGWGIAWFPVWFFYWQRQLKCRRIAELGSHRIAQIQQLKQVRFEAWSEWIGFIWILAVYSFYLLNFGDVGATGEVSARPVTALLALAAICCFIVWSGLVFLQESLKRSPDVHVATVCPVVKCWWGYLVLACVLIAIRYFGELELSALTWVMRGLFLLPGLELLLTMVGRIGRKRRRFIARRDAFDFYCFQVVLHPGKIRKMFQNPLTDPLELETAGAQFRRMAWRFLVPGMVGTGVFLWLLTSVVILPTGQQGAVLRFGQLTGRVISAGLNFKAPWPIDRVRAFDVWQIRRIRVGSHYIGRGEGEIYRSDVPILWTNNHGVMDDELLIVAAPRDMMNYISGDRKTPSISLVGADITVEYRINSISDYLMAGPNVQDYFYEIAMQLTSRSLLRYDVDGLFCWGRIKLPQLLQTKLQQRCDELRLGIKILNIGLSGVHPPQKVAHDFQATVAALQEKVTAIEKARQEAIQQLAAVAGTVEQARIMLTSGEKIASHSAQADGKIAKLLAEARAYRCEKVNSELGQAMRFHQDRLLYRACPEVYLNHRMMSTLENGLGDSFKCMLIGDRDKLVVRFKKKNSNFE